ncbi:metallophosphoesterase family protein [Pseudomonadales bacterium]|nr:metallophosphoesterase family protein [Pseudomonadales bacterium]MDC1238987.1 metallophosphoesterase family protein [Pseudomonadales bacterium]
MKKFIIFTILMILAGCDQKNSGQQQVTYGQTLSGSASALMNKNPEIERLFLQQLSASGVIIKWRGAADKVRLGKESTKLDAVFPARMEDGHQIAYVSGLEADTDYYYSVGNTIGTTQTYHFRTAPETGSSPEDGSLRFWLLGDSGTATEFERDGKPSHPGEAKAVLEGFMKYNNGVVGDQHIDGLLLLGDNAYPAGTDAEWQGAFFDIYPEIISSAVVLPTIGNHEMGMAPINICLFTDMLACDLTGEIVYPLGGASMSSDPSSYDSDDDGPDSEGLPYLNIFTLPTRGELGGAASGTEQYYSSDFGNVHIISLDSQLSNFDDDLRGAMKDWLVADLQASAEQDWKIVIFHHPPYSKGENHDSDLEQREIDMRTTFAPLFEEYGVDVVYSGHSHSYERSWYLSGHYGLSNSFTIEEHVATDSDGNPSFGSPDTPYSKDNRLVYTVAGSSGKFNKWHPCEPEQFIKGQAFGCTKDDWLLHPAHRTFEALAEDYRRHGIARLGSVVIDATATRLTSRFIDDKGTVLDTFAIRK